MKKIFTILLILLLLSGCSLLTKENVLDAREEIADKDYKDAVKSLESVESDINDMTPDQKGEFYILKARALFALERYEEAIFCLNKVIKLNPDSLFEVQAKVLLKKWSDS
ncbi:MAG: tetratricopeptide repeat protein [Desulfobacterales bacterium]|nr:tetratricopeptide repeat protein [Desulfobacterales bacterium]